MSKYKRNKPRKELCSTYIAPSIKQKFYDKCDENGFTPAEQLRRFVYEYINN